MYMVSHSPLLTSQLPQQGRLHLSFASLEREAPEGSDLITVTWLICGGARVQIQACPTPHPWLIPESPAVLLTSVPGKAGLSPEIRTASNDH